MDTIVIAGKEFRHKPYTLATRDAYEAKCKELNERGQNDPTYSDFDYYVDILPYIAEGPTDEVEPGDIEGRSFERFESAFFPQSRQVLSGLINSFR